MNEIFGGFPFEEKCTKLGGFNSGSLVFSYILVCQKIECPFFVLSAQFDRDWGPAEPQMIKKPNLHNSWSFSFFQKNLLTKPANLAKNGFWKFEKPPNRQNGGFWAVLGGFWAFLADFWFFCNFYTPNLLIGKIWITKFLNSAKPPIWRFLAVFVRFGRFNVFIIIWVIFTHQTAALCK